MQFLHFAIILRARFDSSHYPRDEMELKLWLDMYIYDWPPFLMCITRMKLLVRSQVWQSHLLSDGFSEGAIAAQL